MRTTSTGSDQAAHPPTFTLFAVAEMRGQIGPCGCTSDPLGDISRTTELVDEARRAGPVIVVDAGSLLYSQNPVPAQLKDQEELKANLLQAIYRDQLHVAAVGLGPADLANGKQSIRLPREAADVTDPQVPLEPPKLIDAGAAKVGVFGVVAADAVTGVTIGDPVAAGKAAIRELRGKGAQVIVGLVQAPNKHDASQLVKAIGGIDFAIAGLGLNAPEPNDTPIEAEKLGDTWLVIPGNRGQIVSRIDVTLDAASPGASAGFVDAIGSGGAAAKIAALDKRLADTDADLARFAADKDADPKFVAAKKLERDQLAAQRVELQKHPLVAPAHGSYFTLDQIKINKMLACSAPVQTAIADYDRQSGEANVKAAASVPPLPVPPGEATYVGKGQCSDCHQEQVDFWKTTVHSHAWQTLVDRGQQYDLSCFGCHVTGSDRPGGATLAKNDDLRDVQCEVCHGPGSIHVAKGGNEKPLALVSSPPIDLCATQCHTKEHSDTFQYEAYLRDITGKGHAEKLHQKLGDGPTGHSLRSAALDKAGHAIGKGCTK